MSTDKVKIDLDSLPDHAWDNLCRALYSCVKATLDDPIEGEKLRRGAEERKRKNEQ